MKLSKLLGAGKSFFGGGEAVSYRANKKVYLPKFNSGKNPFTAADKPEAADKAAPAGPEQISAQPVPAPAAVVAAPKPARPAGWGKLNPFRAPEPAAPMPNLQPELLSLDSVKVLHNDLSDAEVEFVPVKSRNNPPASPPTGGFMDEAVLKTA
jgi:hypothetical protein